MAEYINQIIANRGNPLGLQLQFQGGRSSVVQSTGIGSSGYVSNRNVNVPIDNPGLITGNNTYNITGDEGTNGCVKATRTLRRATNQIGMALTGKRYLEDLLFLKTIPDTDKTYRAVKMYLGNSPASTSLLVDGFNLVEINHHLLDKDTVKKPKDFVRDYWVDGICIGDGYAQIGSGFYTGRDDVNNITTAIKGVAKVRNIWGRVVVGQKLYLMVKLVSETGFVKDFENNKKMSFYNTNQPEKRRKLDGVNESAKKRLVVLPWTRNIQMLNKNLDSGAYKRYEDIETGKENGGMSAPDICGQSPTREDAVTYIGKTREPENAVFIYIGIVERASEREQNLENPQDVAYGSLYNTLDVINVCLNINTRGNIFYF